MDDISKLEAIQLELHQIGKRLGDLFPNDHPRFDELFEDIGAAGYYLEEARYLLKTAVKTLQNDRKNDEE